MSTITWDHADPQPTPAHITEADARWIRLVCAATLRALHCTDFHITLSNDPADKDNYAEFRGSVGKHSGVVAVHKDWCELSWERRLTCLIHECLHAVTNERDQDLENALDRLDTLVGAERIEEIGRSFSLHDEFVIDRLTYVVRDLLAATGEFSAPVADDVVAAEVVDDDADPLAPHLAPYRDLVRQLTEAGEELVTVQAMLTRAVSDAGALTMGERKTLAWLGRFVGRWSQVPF